MELAGEGGSEEQQIDQWEEPDLGGGRAEELS